MATSNEILFDQLLQQQTFLQKGIANEAASLVNQLSASDAKTSGWVTRRLMDLEKQGFPQTKVRTFIRSLRVKRDKQLEVLMKGMTEAQAKTAKVALGSTMKATTAALSGMPVDALLGMPDAAVVGGIANATVFGGEIAHTIGEWGVNLKGADYAKISGAIQSGVANGLTTPQITRNVEKVFGTTRNNADALTKTALNHGANTGRQEFFEENSDVLAALRWNSTLDGRTSPICRSLDGHFRPVKFGDDYDGVPEPHLPQGGPQRPPAHLRCRSLLLGILEGEAIADQLAHMDRATVRDVRTGKQRQIDFEKDARARAAANGDKWSKMTKGEKSSYRKFVRKEWADKHVGRAPGDMNYNDWLRKQPAGFQDQVLGQKAGQIYRANPKMTMDKFVATDGKQFTLAQLEATNLKPGKYKVDAAKAQARQQKLVSAEAEAKKAAKAKAARQLEALKKKNAATAKKNAAMAKKNAELHKKLDAAKAKATAADKKAKAALDKQKKIKEQQAATEARRQKRIADKKKAKDRVSGPNRSQADRKQSLERGRRRLRPEDVTRKSVARGNEIRREEFARPLVGAEKRMTNGEVFAMRNARTTARIRAEIPVGEHTLDFKKWLKTIDSDEYEALGRWATDEGASGIRALQRGVRIRDEAEEFIDLYGRTQTHKFGADLERIIARGPGYQDTVSRGMLMRPAKFNKLKVGSPFSEKALASGTYNPRIAKNFAEMRYNQVGGQAIPVVLKIEGGMGAKAVNISYLTGLTQESEILISSLTKYEIVRLRKTSGIGGKLWEITLRVKNK